MKPLLLSFFAVILCYSLFFDRGEAQKRVDDTNYRIRTESCDTYQLSDSVPFHASRFSLVNRHDRPLFIPARFQLQAPNLIRFY